MPTKELPAKTVIDAQGQLDLVILRNAHLRIERDTPRAVVLELDTVYPRWLGPLPGMLGAKAQKKIALDGLGLLMWRQIDDRRTLGNLIDWLATEQQLEFNEARLLTLRFLHDLAQRGVVVMGKGQ